MAPELLHWLRSTGLIPAMEALSGTLPRPAAGEVGLLRECECVGTAAPGSWLGMTLWLVVCVNLGEAPMGVCRQGSPPSRGDMRNPGVEGPEAGVAEVCAGGATTWWCRAAEHTPRAEMMRGEKAASPVLGDCFIGWPMPGASLLLATLVMPPN